MTKYTHFATIVFAFETRTEFKFGSAWVTTTDAMCACSFRLDSFLLQRELKAAEEKARAATKIGLHENLEKGICERFHEQSFVAGRGVAWSKAVKEAFKEIDRKWCVAKNPDGLDQKKVRTLFMLSTTFSQVYADAQFEVSLSDSKFNLWCDIMLYRFDCVLQLAVMLRLHSERTSARRCPIVSER